MPRQEPTLAKAPVKHWQEESALYRFKLISPLLDESLDPAKKCEIRKRLAKQNDISIRSLYRYERAYQSGGFTDLLPKTHEPKRHPGLVENFEELVTEAIQLKREIPSRSVAQIILILEMEGRVAPGMLHRSTLQRYLYRNGFGKKQMRKYAEARNTSSKRFCKPHRMMLVESDIKYGIKLPIGSKGKKVQTYLVVIIDNHSRYVLEATWYDHQRETIVADCYHRAILKHGKMAACYHDQGKQFVSKQLIASLSKLGICVIKAKPYQPQSKGGVEVFNRLINGFLDEIAAQKVRTIDELNNYFSVWLEQYYHQKPHDGIAEYYKSLDVTLPPGGISPLQEWNRDSRPLTFLDSKVVGEAFLRREKREVDNSGCIRVGGKLYETSTSLIGAKVEISYDPLRPSIITISYPEMTPFIAQPVTIGEFCDPKPAIPKSMLPEDPEISRFLESLKKQREKSLHMQTNALSFSNYGREGQDHV
jgi:IS30 family transposase